MVYKTECFVGKGSRGVDVAAELREIKYGQQVPIEELREVVGLERGKIETLALKRIAKLVHSISLQDAEAVLLSCTNLKALPIVVRV